MAATQYTQTTYDTIIVGSGAGGLSAAICLARAGQTVLVLEQHEVPGGWCHSFYLQGHRFTPGVHYIGLLDKGQSTNELYKGLGIADDLVFFRMNPKAYEHCWIGEERIDLPANFDQLCTTLGTRFPKEKKNISKYLTTVRNVSRQLQLIPKISGIWQNITIPFRTKDFGKYALFSVKRVMNWHVKNPLAQKVLNIQYGDHGLPPGKASFPLHCAVMDHYFQGGFYPMGGGGAIVKAMTKAIKKYGGIVKTGKRVAHILIEGSRKKKAVGVQLIDGTQIFAKQIISNADPEKTYMQLVGKKHLSTKLQKKITKTNYSCTSLMLFLIVDMDVRKAGLDSGNIWLMPDQDMDELFEQMTQSDITKGKEFPGLFVSCTTLKDPTSFDGRYHTIEAITYIDHKAFAAFKNEEQRRSQAYLDFKMQLTKKMITTVEKIIPELRKHLVHAELGTPLTNEYYINATKGCVYGTEKSLRQIGPFAFKSQSEIEYLYLCGASIVSHGVAGASFSGVQTAAQILQTTQEELLAYTHEQQIQIYEAEDAAEYPEWLQRKIAIRKVKKK